MRALGVLLLAWGLGLAASAQVAPWQASGGRIVIHFLEDALEQAGLELTAVDETAETFDTFVEVMNGELLGFRTSDESRLLALRERGGENFVPYGILGGELEAVGGFTLVSATNGKSVDFHDFRIFPREVRNDGPGGEPDPDYFFLSTAAGGEPDFLLCYVKIYFADGEDYVDPGADHDPPPTLRIKAWDLVVTPALADKLDRPDLLGRTLGYGKIEADAFPYDGPWTHPQGQNIFTPTAGGGAPEGGGSGKDVKLGLLTSVVQLGHVGTFPDGRTGMSMSTTSCNAGTVDVPWLKPETVLQQDHPGVAMAMYRELDGRFEQVAISWIKHGFFALSQSQCTPCTNPSNGTFLGVGCSDTYGTINNGERFWLGPRDEWDPRAGTWECQGSYFDGTPEDCFRDEDGEGNGPVNHRLEAPDDWLGVSGAKYYYEAMYIVRDDDDLHNNIGSRECTMSWNGSAWFFSTPAAGNPLVEGPAIERWGEKRTTAGLAPHDGDAILAVQTTQLGPAAWRYEYALFNWTMDRRPGSFSIPACGAVWDVSFRDFDKQATNDWVADTSNRSVTFTYPGTPGVGHKRAGPLEFGTLYNFGFTSSVPPATRDASVGIHDAGPGGDFLGLETLAPDCLAVSVQPQSPAPGTTADIVIRGGDHGAMLAAIAVNGVPLPVPLVLTPTPVPFGGGDVVLPLPVPAFASGISATLVAADVDTKVRAISNLANFSVP